MPVDGETLKNTECYTVSQNTFLDVKNPKFIQSHTIDISAMILNDVNARPISSVPDADAEVPAAWHEQIRHLRIPEKSTDWASVSVEYPHRSTFLRVIPHPYSATTENKLRPRLSAQLLSLRRWAIGLAAEQLS